MALVLLAVFLAGCGGGGGEQTVANVGGIRVTVDFPVVQTGAAPAVIHEQTNSITVQIVDTETGDPVRPATVINRPSPQGGEVSATILDVPEGNWLLVVSGWENEDGGGKMLSTASDMVTVTTGQTVEKSIVMQSWPYELALSVANNPILIDETAQLVVTPLDVDGNVILRNFVYSFSSNNPGICSVSANVGPLDVRSSAGATTGDATLTAIARGKAVITATLEGETVESGSVSTAQTAVTGSITMDVWPNLDEVVMDPSSITIYTEEKLLITAQAKYQGNVVEDIDFNFVCQHPNLTIIETTQNTVLVEAVSPGQALVEAHQPYTDAYGTSEVSVIGVVVEAVQSKTD